ncbi:conserved exported protein of unknown function [Rhodovastum atsumiense]|nr:DUF4142 domain-containing protein [Rhodovastum atsumiense]CAH2601807.1 conserved exported protein of unknown function [Rhodovastum atsumiense]
MPASLQRRPLLAAALALSAAAPGIAMPAEVPPRPLDPGRFLVFACSSAHFQQRAATLAATRDVRPEVKQFAQGMADFRRPQLEQLRALAQQRGVRIGSEEEFEHKVVLENLEPLDYLALTRRYTEVQIQALEQEIRGYEEAAKGPDEGLKTLAAGTLPQLHPRLDAARRLQEAVKP